MMVLYALARLLLGLIFLYSGMSKLMAIMYRVNIFEFGFPPHSVLIYVATGIDIVGGLSLITRAGARFSAWLLAGYLLAITFFVRGGIPTGLQLLRIYENVAIVGGLITVSVVEFLLDRFNEQELRNRELRLELERSLAAKTEITTEKRIA